ncbi:MAG: hypothetical protein RLZZ156_2037 [Deinococcota bacterium]
MTKIRAKFKCDSAGISVWGKKEKDGEILHQTEFKFSPVHDPDPQSENGRFYRATPQGNIVLMATSLANDAFSPGEEYYVEFSPAT